MRDNLIDVFASRVASDRNAIAVTFRGESTSYGQLDVLSERVAEVLCARQVDAEEPIGLFMDRGVEAVSAIVGIAKAGCAYVPLDTSSPAARLRLIATECALGCILVDTPDRVGEVREFCGPDVDVVVFGDLEAGRSELSLGGMSEKSRISPMRLAYIVYTSGSTGIPKGVGVSHASLVGFALDPCWSNGLDESVLHHSPLNFDASVFEVWMPLLRGGRVVVAPRGEADAHALRRLIVDQQVACAFVTTSYFNVLVEEHPGIFAGMRQVWTGGEAANPATMQRAVQACGPGSVVNVYGPTEATVFSTYHVVPDERVPVVPLGRPLSGVRVYVLDEDLRPVENGRPGELCLAGPGVARGYHQRPALTAERFVPDPFAGDGSRIYRTGDLVMPTEDGRLEFVGRRDRQVKVRGFRVELGEIENKLVQRDDTAAAAVVSHPDAHGDNALHAYLVPRARPQDVRGVPAKEVQELPDQEWGHRVLAELHESVPAYMVPLTCTVLDRMPLNANGKLDLRALPAPTRTVAHSASGTPYEERLRQIFAEVLGLEHVGIEDDFFQLGGQSLLAVRAAARIERFWGVRLGVRDLYDAPTAAELAARLAARPDAAPGTGPGAPAPLAPRARTAHVPLSYAQRRLWLLNQVDPGSGPAYHVPVVYRTRQDVDARVLRDALGDVMGRQENLRTVVVPDLEIPVQRVLGAGEWSPDVRVTACAPEELEDLLVASARAPFDLGRDLPVRAEIFRTGEETVLQLVLHHIAADGWSITPLSRDLGAAYAARAGGRDPELGALPVQYGDYALWQQELMDRQADTTWEEQLSYWTTRLKGIPEELPLPFDRSRPAVASHRGDLLDFELSADLCRELEELARRSGTSLFAALHAGLAGLLTRLRAGEDIVVGSPIAGRQDSALDEVIGFFVNTVVLRTDTSGNPSFGELLDRVREGWLSAYAHQDVPFDLLVERLNPPRSLARHPVLQVGLGLLDTPGMDRSVEGLSATWNLGNTRAAKVDLYFTLMPRLAADGGLDGTVEYSTDLFDAGTVRRMVDRLILLLRDAVAHPELPLGSLRIMDEDERRGLLAGVEEQADGDTVVRLFRTQVERHPQKIAVKDGERLLTYRELDARSEALARRLAVRQAGNEACVALLLDRGEAAVTSLVGILKAGAAYVPLDPQFPAARMARMLTDCEVRTVLVDSAERLDLVRQCAPEGTEVLLVDVEVREGLAAGPEPVVAGPSGPDQLAYVMYTSGSTGAPKGVGVSHRNIVGFATTSQLTDADVERVLMHCPLAFDASNFDVWVPLLRGGCVVVAPVGADGVAGLHRVLVDEDITAVAMTTALFNLTVEEHPEVFARLARVWTGGEAASPAAIARAREFVGPGVVVNAYGPTEATTVAICHPVHGVDAAGVPLGTPLNGVRAHLVDGFGNLAGIGMSGELCIGGYGVARGYVGQPGLTAERFVPDPFGPPGSRMYRTGDLVRRRADGELDFVGRLDRQVKIRGFRIEPDEIETRLTGLPEVGQAVVEVRDDAAAGRILVAYVVPAAGSVGDRETLSGRLRDSLGERVPAYMVPAAVVVLDALPMTTNGKIDRRALPAPAVRTGSRKPRTDEERVLCGLFADVLGREEVGADDGFFQLGGHSLLAVRLVGKLRDQHGIDMSVGTLFASPSPAELVVALGDEARRLPEGHAVAPEQALAPGSTSPGAPVPLSFAQQRLWFLSQLWPGRPDYNLPVARRLKGPLDPGRLRSALTALLSRHDILRTRYEVRDDQPVQLVERVAEPEFHVVDLHTATADEAGSHARREIAAEAAKPFDLGVGPPVRFCLFRQAEDDHILLMTVHHIAADGWSTELLWRDLAELYGAGTRPTPPTGGLRYADYAHWERAQQLTSRNEADLDYWRERLKDIDPVELPADRERPATQSGRGAQLDFEIPQELRGRLIELGKQCGATPFVVLLTAFQLLVGKLTNRRHIEIGVPVAGRGRPELDTLVGLFANTLVLRGEIDPACTFAELLHSGRQQAAEAYSHGGVPFERLVGEISPERDLSRNPLFQLMFSMADTVAGGGSEKWEGLATEAFPVTVMAAKFDFEIAVTDCGDRFVGNAFYATDLFAEPTVDRLLRLYVELLTAVTDRPEVPVEALDVVTAEADRLTRQEWNRTATEFDLDRCLHELITAQSERTPDATAVEHGEQVMTYALLDEQSDRIARSLIREGVEAGSPVGVWMDRCVELPAALLGVLKAGGAYVPLDPDLPPARAAQLLDEARARLCLVQDPPCGVLPAQSGVRLVTAGDQAETAPAAPSSDRRVRPDDLASIFFTSGSTGTPKGVANTHRGWVNRMWWMHQQHGLAPGEGVLHKTVLSFDDSAVELFWPLMVGGRVVMLDPGMHRDPRAVLRATTAHDVAVLQFVPSMLALFLDELTDETVARLGGLRHVISSGEALRPDLVARFHERLGPVGCALHNQWGPTEASIDATWHRCVPQDAERTGVPIGRPLANYQVHVLDGSMRPVLPGIEGELYVGGVGLARGYWNDPGKTAEAFVPDVFRPGERLYRTGDRGTRLADGTVLFHGRADHQIKIRGVRVEPAEIEGVVLAREDVAEAVVHKWELTPSDQRLALYLVPAGGESVDTDELRGYLAKRLPPYMVPSHLTVLPGLPLLASGKVDRKQLPSPRAEALPVAGEAKRRPPRTDSELLVAGVWSDFLDADDAGANFFHLGGHSLLATRIISRLRRLLDADLPLVMIFEHPTIEDLSAAIERELLGETESGLTTDGGTDE
ncbi:amino acid adenylation domain-containing protein [Streptomyces sp. NPDC059918]|uniref:non-ribosomal peptide synthetase n=1 Tax=unclassified Streptomyces TaxID=2593676 RepID=UPI00365D76EB